MRRTACLALSSVICVAALFSAIPTHAEQLMKLPPEMRLVRGTPDQGEASENAAVGKMSADQLPPSVLEDVQAKLLGYSSDLKQTSALSVYYWDSPWFHQQNTPPNYVIDFSGVQPTQKVNANTAEPPCTDEGCLIIGYTYVIDPATGGGTYKQDFDIRSHQTSFIRVNEPDGKNYQVQIRTLSNRDNCEADGVNTKQGCVRQFTWRKFGLAVLPPSPQ